MIGVSKQFGTWKSGCNCRNRPVKNSGVIFDLDGVIVDTEEAHRKAWKEQVTGRGMSFSESLWQEMFGRTNQEIISNVLGWTDDPDQIREIAEKKEKKYRRIVKKDGLRMIDGAKPLIESLSGSSLKLGLCSSTPEENVSLALRVTSLQSAFSVTVTGDDVKRGKPDPEPFELTMDQMDVNPEKGMVIEDSPSGIKGARSLGIPVLALATTRSPSELREANRIRDDLGNVSGETIRRMLEEIPAGKPGKE